MRRPRLAILVALAALVSVTAANRKAEAQRPRTPPMIISSLSGRDLFQFYCAACHGPAGKGDGPVVSSLKRQPPDLTTIAERNSGHFPTGRLEQYVAGENEPPAAHGSREMPVWGPIFRSLEPRDRLTRIRIANVVAFVESLQSKH